MSRQIRNVHHPGRKARADVQMTDGVFARITHAGKLSDAADEIIDGAGYTAPGCSFAPIFARPIPNEGHESGRGCHKGHPETQYLSMKKVCSFVLEEVARKA